MLTTQDGNMQRCAPIPVPCAKVVSLVRYTLHYMRVIVEALITTAALELADHKTLTGSVSELLFLSCSRVPS